MHAYMHCERHPWLHHAHRLLHHAWLHHSWLHHSRLHHSRLRHHSHASLLHHSHGWLHHASLHHASLLRLHHSHLLLLLLLHEPSLLRHGEGRHHRVHARAVRIALRQQPLRRRAVPLPARSLLVRVLHHDRTPVEVLPLSAHDHHAPPGRSCSR